jgi:uncharacterized protein
VKLLPRNEAKIGPLLESFVLSELARLLPLSDLQPSLFHFRNRDGVEVDGVLEAPDGSIVGIEVKASDLVRAEDLSGLSHLRDRAGASFLAGYVFYTGKLLRSLGDRLWALPIDALWA